MATQRVQKNLAGFGFAAVAPPEIFRKISPPVTRTILSSSKLFRIMNNDVRGHEEGAENVAANGNDSATDARLLLLLRVFFAIAAVLLIVSEYAGSTWQFWIVVAAGAGVLGGLRLVAGALEGRRAELVSLMSSLMLLAIWGAGMALKMGGKVTMWLVCVVLLDWLVQGMMRVARKIASRPWR